MKILFADSNSQDFIEITDLLFDSNHELKLAISGSEAIQMITSFSPDILILEMQLNDMSGLDILKAVRSDPDLNQIIVFFLTADSSPEKKVKAFELGADEFIKRPFKPADLITRLDVIFQRLQSKKENEPKNEEELQELFIAKKIVFHSLRGGSGVSTLAANAAVALRKLWEKPIVVVDTAFYNGQTSMLFNINSKRHFGELKFERFTGEAHPRILTLIEEHISGVKIIPAPRYPIALDFLNEIFWDSVSATLTPNFQYLIVDTPHDFSDHVILNLIDADLILLVVTPEMAALKVAVSALKTYKQLGINPEHIQIILNQNIPNATIDKEKIERALGVVISFEIPYEPVEVLRSINIGMPFSITKSNLPITLKIEELAYSISTENQKSIQPAIPTKAYLAFSERLSGKNKK